MEFFDPLNFLAEVSYRRCFDVLWSRALKIRWLNEVELNIH